MGVGNDRKNKNPKLVCLVCHICKKPLRGTKSKDIIIYTAIDDNGNWLDGVLIHMHKECLKKERIKKK